MRMMLQALDREVKAVFPPPDAPPIP